jgi:hypothetical protein
MTPIDELPRLRDLDAAPGSVEAEAAGLLRAAERHVPSAAAKMRVRAALIRTPRPGFRFALQPILIVVLIVAGGAAAAGSSPGRRWLGRGYRRLVTWVAPGAAAPRPQRVARAVSPIAAGPEQPAPPGLQEPAVVAPAPVHEVVAPRRAEARAAHHVERPAQPLADGDEPVLVAAAVRALRRDHNPARARALLDQYLRRWPDGALVEEAMALEIESSQALGQAGAAGDVATRALAARYLQRFPGGRFASVAQRALARPAP